MFKVGDIVKVKRFGNCEDYAITVVEDMIEKEGLEFRIEKIIEVPYGLGINFLIGIKLVIN